MKSPIKLLVLAAGLALFSVGCASHGHVEATVSAPADQFYCHNCHGYHPYSHSHYRVYYNDRYRSRHYHEPARTTVVVQPPGLPPPPRPPRPF